jgi:eukaryotic-like serine/threonine-protein kinase
MFSQLVNQTLDRYKVLNLLGEGGMGAVFKAFDLTLQREVAVKVMHPNFASQQDFQDRFLQEARTAARLDHPSIVQVYDFGQTQGLLYIVMEFIPGDNLGKMLKDLRAGGKWILLPESVNLIRQVALALDYAHAHGVLHRDIKPGNIMIEPISSDGLPYRPVLTDLGLAKLIGGGLQTMDGTSMGTPAYMSPEQALGNLSDARSDVYSLGVLLFELATGKLPFPARNLIEAIHYHTKEPPPQPKSINPEIPDMLDAHILRAMEKDPKQRFQTAGEMGLALAKLLPDLGIANHDPTVLAEHVSLLTQYEQSLVEVRGASVLEEFEPVSHPVQDRVQVMRDGKTTHNVAIKATGLTIGRDADSDICLDDTGISRRHARIEVSGNRCQVIDLGSTNGTYMGNARLLPGVAEEWTSDRPLRMGKFWLRLIRSDSGDRTAVTRMTHGTQIDTSRMHTSTGQGRIGVFLETEQLSVEPGMSVDLPIILLNQSQLVDHFRVSVEGIPGRWLPIMPPVLNLMPGDQQQVALTIAPTRSPKNRAGRYPFTVKVSSEQAPDEIVSVSAVLTLAAYAEFNAEIHPQRIRIEKPARVSVSNLGNLPEVFTISMRDQADELNFKPPKIQLRIPEGQTASTIFTAGMRQFRIVGREKMHAFQVQVTAPKGAPKINQGEFISQGILPMWLFGLLVVLCLGVTGASAMLAGGVWSQVSNATQTYEAGLTSVAQVVEATNLASTGTASVLETQGVAAIQAATATEAWMILDDDRDGLDNRKELELGTLPNVRDTDEDNLSDGEEVQRKTNPLDDDTDNDGLKDGAELVLGTDPLVNDTDKDGIPDNQDSAPLATSTPPPTATVPTPIPSSTKTPTVPPSLTPSPTVTLSPTIPPTPTPTPTPTLPPTSYTTNPPLIDGVVTAGEWDAAFLAMNIPNGAVYYFNDSQNLYLLIDLTNDTFNDPPLVGSPWGDYFYVGFDVNENQVIDSNVDFSYVTYPGTYTLGVSYYLGPGSFTGVQPCTSVLGPGFGISHKSATNHRIWEFALKLSEIQAAAGQNVAMGVITNSQNPAFLDYVPGNYYTSVASFTQFHLDSP